MQVFGIPGWVWINLILLVAAAIFVGAQIAAAEKAGRQKPESKPVSADLRRAIN
jgi:Na+-transporting methylmalonyl-CoA/oxaloacetate decarboxylase gamma subunit